MKGIRIRVSSFVYGWRAVWVGCLLSLSGCVTYNITHSYENPPASEQPTFAQVTIGEPRASDSSGSGIAELKKLSHTVRHHQQNGIKAKKAVSPSPLQLVQHEEVLPAPGPLPADASQERYPIDLATVWQLAGANNLQIILARERVQEAQARWQGAKALWLPSLNLGVGYHYHAGRIQETRGDVVDITRSSFFAGGGPNVGDNPLGGPSAGPPRFFVGLSPADALFAPLAERLTTQATDAGRAAVFNDTLLEVSLAYLDLVEAQNQIAIAQEAVQNTEELVRIIIPMFGEARFDVSAW